MVLHHALVPELLSARNRGVSLVESLRKVWQFYLIPTLSPTLSLKGEGNRGNAEGVSAKTG